MSAPPSVTSYGAPISLEKAKKAAAAALAEARRNNLAAAIVNPDGTLIYFEKMDGTQSAGALVAVDEARGAAPCKRPTKAL